MQSRIKICLEQLIKNNQTPISEFPLKATLRS